MRSLMAVFCLLTVPAVWAVDEDDGLGAHPGWLARQGTGIVSAGRGHADGGSAEPGVTDAFANPARLAFHGRWQVGGGVTALPLQRQDGGLSVLSPVGRRLGVGAALLYRRDASVPLFDEGENPEGEVAPSFQQVYVGLGWKLSRSVGVGGALSFYQEDLDLPDEPSFSATARLDLSAWRRSRNGAWTAGVVVRNIGLAGDLVAREERGASVGTGQPGATASSSVPRILELGAGHSRTWRGVPFELLATLLLHETSNEALVTADQLHPQIRVGLEVRPDSVIRARAGFNQGTWAVGGSWRVLPRSAPAATEESNVITPSGNLWIDVMWLSEREAGPAWGGVGLRWEARR